MGVWRHENIYRFVKPGTQKCYRKLMSQDSKAGESGGSKIEGQSTMEGHSAASSFSLHVNVTDGQGRGAVEQPREAGSARGSVATGMPRGWGCWRWMSGGEWNISSVCCCWLLFCRCLFGSSLGSGGGVSISFCRVPLGLVTLCYYIDPKLGEDWRQKCEPNRMMLGGVMILASSSRQNRRLMEGRGK